jgi:hypothetical protein
LQTVRITFENSANFWNDRNIQGYLNIVRSSRSEKRTVMKKPRRYVEVLQAVHVSGADSNLADSWEDTNAKKCH